VVGEWANFVLQGSRIMITKEALIHLIIYAFELVLLDDNLDRSFIMDVLKGWLGASMIAIASTSFLLGAAFHSRNMNVEIYCQVQRLLGVYATLLIGLLAS